MQMDFRQFSRNNMFVSILGKLSEIHLHAWLFANPCKKVLIIVAISWSSDLRAQHIEDAKRFKSRCCCLKFLATCQALELGSQNQARAVM